MGATACAPVVADAAFRTERPPMPLSRGAGTSRSTSSRLGSGQRLRPRRQEVAVLAGPLVVTRSRRERPCRHLAAQGSDVLTRAADSLPTEVDNYKVQSVCVTPQLPDGRREICALVVSDVEDHDEIDYVMWNPPAGSAAQQAISHMRDAFGVLGVWPASWVAAERVLSVCRARQRQKLRFLEIGCGAGLPSLCALAAGAEVVATDLEELPLKLLQAAAESQHLPGSLRLQQVDVLAAAGMSSVPGGLVRRIKPCPSEQEAFDVIVCSDCLYKHDVAQAVGRLLGRVLLRRPATVLVVTDANRSGRQAFLDELDSVLGLSRVGATPPYFEATAIPAWAADDARDPFDGTTTHEVGLLKLA
eukprot:TRINITY_DN111109_c0_g1_i1.p1 TRINITY_DN111109_c0_g1~~TRINITY_DN111109_c0_g1_i1.p1  ORF type:complete len:374 (-),score=58.40 TRINITY_DN111109_c0_g1_i1:50-1129(-)